MKTEHLSDTCVIELKGLDESQRKRLESILMRHKYGHEYPSNINGLFLSVNKSRRKFHRFLKLNRETKGLVKNDFDEVLSIITEVSNFEVQIATLKTFITS